MSERALELETAARARAWLASSRPDPRAKILRRVSGPHAPRCPCPHCLADRAARADIRATFADLEHKGPRWRSLQLRGLLARAKGEAGGAETAAMEDERACHEALAAATPRTDVSGDRPEAGSLLESQVITVSRGRITRLGEVWATPPTPPEPGTIPVPLDTRRARFLDPAEWLGEVEALTESHRRALARQHLRTRLEALGAADGSRPDVSEPGPAFNLDITTENRRRKQALARALKLGRRPPTDEERRRSSATWHGRREIGQLERFGRVRWCGEGELAVRCTACHCEEAEHTIPRWCSVGRLCVGCRARAAARRQDRVDAAARRLMQEAQRRGFLHRRRKGGPWTEKLVTLTAPHIASSRWTLEGRGECAEVGDRVQLVLGAWRAFSHRLRAWSKKRGAVHGFPVRWYRFFEWTPGGDGGGHPHFHLWFFGPILPAQWVETWWSEALTRAGLQWVETCGLELEPCRTLSSPAWANCSSSPVDPGELGARRCLVRPCDLVPAEDERHVTHRLSRRCGRSRALVELAAMRLVWVGVVTRKGPGRRPQIVGGRCALHATTFVDVRGFASSSRALRLEADKGGRAIKGTGQGSPRRDALDYVDGWSIVDIDGNGTKVDPLVAARLFEVLEGRRMVQCSRGLLSLPPRAHCVRCGAVGMMRVSALRTDLSPGLTGPPARAMGPPS